MEVSRPNYDMTNIPTYSLISSLRLKLCVASHVVSFHSFGAEGCFVESARGYPTSGVARSRHKKKKIPRRRRTPNRHHLVNLHHTNNAIVFSRLYPTNKKKATTMNLSNTSLTDSRRTLDEMSKLKPKRNSSSTSRNRASLCFGTVQVLEFPVVVGDNPDGLETTVG